MNEVRNGFIQNDIKKTRDGKIQIGVWVKKDTYAKAKEVARTQELTFSDILRIALKEYLAKRNK